jgi:hypothetical protein
MEADKRKSKVIKGEQNARLPYLHGTAKSKT